MRFHLLVQECGLDMVRSFVTCNLSVEVEWTDYTLSGSRYSSNSGVVQGAPSCVGPGQKRDVGGLSVADMGNAGYYRPLVLQLSIVIFQGSAVLA